jgi:hypothetical protein
LVASLAGLLIGAIAIGVGHFGSNYSASSAGRKWLLGGMGAAILCGLAWTIVTTLFSATGGWAVRKLAVVGAVLVVVLGVGTALTRAGRGTASRAPDSPLAADPVRPAVGVADGGGSEGESRTPPPMPVEVLDQARLAALNVVARTGEVVSAGFFSRRELIESFTTAEFGPVLADETSRSVNAMLAELGSRQVNTTKLAVREQPLTATAEPVGAGRVRVRVWSVLVAAAPGTGPGRQFWRTVTVEMVARDGVWLVDGWVSSPGPTPAMTAEGVVDAAETVAVPLGWVPVGVGW